MLVFRGKPFSTQPSKMPVRVSSVSLVPLMAGSDCAVAF
jgi:hypothetical protein